MPLVKWGGVCGPGRAGPGQAALLAPGEGLREQWLGCVWPQEPCSLGRGGGKGEVKEAKGKSLQHLVFPGGLPSKY